MAHNENAPRSEFDFLSLEDEIKLRMQFKSIIDDHGSEQLLIELGAIQSAFRVGLQVWTEFTLEETKRMANNEDKKTED